MRTAMVLGLLVAGGAGCATLLGVDDYQAVDCAGDCGADGGPAPGDGAASADDAVARETGADAGAAVDASGCPGLDAPCPDGNRLVVAYFAAPDSGSLFTSPSGITVAPGETGTGCFGSDRLRLYPGSGLADFVGVVCEDGNTNVERCEINVTRPMCVTATRR